MFLLSPHTKSNGCRRSLSGCISESIGAEAETSAGLRPGTNRRDTEESEFFEIPLSAGEDIQADLEHREIQQKLTEHIRSLPEKLKTVVYLFYAAEMQIAEIADTLHISSGTVKSRLYLARTKLKKDLEADGYEI